MKKHLVWPALLVVVTISFLMGYWMKAKSGDKPGEGRRILYYVDPMNPGHRSDKPGIAPCGMQLEPVYADNGGNSSAPATDSSMPPGTVHISPEREQLVGVKLEVVERGPWSQTVRLPGRVVPDENRVFRITAAADGWTTRVLPNSTDSLVTKNQLLATFYTPELYTAMKAYVYAVKSLGRLQFNSANNTSDQANLDLDTLENYKNALRNMGMTDYQLDQILKAGKGAPNIEIRAPGPGVILSRDLSPGQRIERGSELYRIADLSRVWILADIFEYAGYLGRPGTQVQVFSPYLKKSFPAKVTSIPPKFDPSTRTMKLRIEAANPGYLLRPDMFVDVEFTGRSHEAITVPSDAVLDSGLKKTVFVARGNGYFEPRRVETGRYAGDRVEIVSGLQPGERVVVSGNFLIDSESRMKSAAQNMSGSGSLDPACGMMVNEGKAAAAGLTTEYSGKKYFFCSLECKRKFDQAPRALLAAPEKKMSGSMDGHGHD